MNYTTAITKQGVKIPVQQDYFVYNAKVPTISAGETKEVSINIEADSSFIWLKTTFEVTNGLSYTPETRIIPTVQVQFRDTGSGRLLFQEPAPIDSIAGCARLPYILPMERVYDPKATINVTFINVNSSDAYTDLVISLHGYKQWPID